MNEPRFRAASTGRGWKVERREDCCSSCGKRASYKTVLYTYMLLPYEEQQSLAMVTADLLNTEAVE